MTTVDVDLGGLAEGVFVSFLHQTVTLVTPFPYIPLEDSRYGTCIFVLQCECDDVLSRGCILQWFYVILCVYLHIQRMASLDNFGTL